MTHDENQIVIHTASGRIVAPLNLTPDQVDIETIAHHLACQARFLGATRHARDHGRIFYSVAEHSIYTSIVVEEVLGRPDLALDALLHDASEAYTGDLIRPLKYSAFLREPYARIEARVERVIAEKFGLAYPMDALVKRADDAICAHELRTIVIGGTLGPGLEDMPTLDIEIEMMGPRSARNAFLARFEELTARGNASMTNERSVA